MRIIIVTCACGKRFKARRSGGRLRLSAEALRSFGSGDKCWDCLPEGERDDLCIRLTGKKLAKLKEG